MGPVNMMALEEYQEASIRFEFLNTQQNDLLDSIRDTRQAIEEIDVVSRQQLGQSRHERLPMLWPRPLPVQPRLERQKCPSNSVHGIRPMCARLSLHR